eukprot:scaffold12312_cov63-Phaeocystis_antarctica.AAC.8
MPCAETSTLPESRSITKSTPTPGLTSLADFSNLCTVAAALKHSDAASEMGYCSRSRAKNASQCGAASEVEACVRQEAMSTGGELPLYALLHIASPLLGHYSTHLLEHEHRGAHLGDDALRLAHLVSRAMVSRAIVSRAMVSRAIVSIAMVGRAMVSSAIVSEDALHLAHLEGEVRVDRLRAHDAHELRRHRRVLVR